MSVLTVNGIALPVALDGLSRLEPELVGGGARAFSGAEMTEVRARKAGWRAKLTPQTASAARALRGLARGEGHSWPFDADLFSGKGLGPSLATGCAVVAFQKYGAGAVQIDPTRRLEYSLPGSATKWTLSFWKFALQIAPAWEHFVILGDGSTFKSGAPTTDSPWATYDGATLSLLASSVAYPAWEDGEIYAYLDLVWAESGPGVYQCTYPGTSLGDYFSSAPNLGDTVEDSGGVQWTRVDDGYGYFDDAMFLPCLVPSSWPAQLYAEASARAWTPLPRLRLAGDAAAGLAAGYATVTGKVLEAPLRRRALAGAAAVTNAEELELELREA